MIMKFTKSNAIPYRPAISTVLVKASASSVFRDRLLTSPMDALGEMNLPPEDVAILADIRAHTLADYAHQLKMRLAMP
jgi:hypothetical protein